jgi:DNA-binding Lrp family transcriptional regulator
MEKELIEMSRREREVLKVMSLVLEGRRSQREAGRLLGLSERQIRRIQRRLRSDNGTGPIIVHLNKLDPSRYIGLCYA